MKPKNQKHGASGISKGETIWECTLELDLKAM